MSSSDEAAVQGAGFDPEGGELTGGGQAGLGASPGLGAGTEVGPPKSGEGEGGLLDNQGQALQSQVEEEAVEVGGRVFSGREGRPGSLTKKRDTQDFGPQVAAEPVAAGESLSSRQARGSRRYRSPESFAAELSAIWAYAEAGPSGRGEMGLGCVEAQQASAASLLCASGPDRGRAWGSPKRGTKTKVVVSGAARRSSSDQESSDEFNEIQLMRSKHISTGKRSVARRTRESQPITREDSDPNGDGVSKAQLPAQKPGPHFVLMRFGEFTSGYSNTRAPQSPGNAQTPAFNLAKSPTPLSDQEAPLHPPVPERQQEVSVTQGCPRCVVLQKEIDDLKEQLAALQALTDSFQAL